MEEKEKNIQLFVGVNSKGEIEQAQMGKNIVVSNPAFPFVFMIDEEMAVDVNIDRLAFRVEIIDFEPKLTQLYKPKPLEVLDIEPERVAEVPVGEEMPVDAGTETE